MYPGYVHATKKEKKKSRNGGGRFDGWAEMTGRVSANSNSILVAILFRGPERASAWIAEAWGSLSSPRSARWVFKKHIPSIWHCAPSNGHFRSLGVERGEAGETRDRRIEVLIVSGLPCGDFTFVPHHSPGLVSSHLGIIGVSGKAGMRPTIRAATFTP